MPTKRKRESESPEIKTELDRKILVAVDFGTTFSGLAWTQTRKSELQTPIIQWPDARSGGLEGITSDKVPSEIQYIGKNYKWGFQIPHHGQRHQWFKLGLDPNQLRGNSRLAECFPDPVAAPPGYDTTAETLVTDYLTALREHTEKILLHKLPHSVVQSTPMEFIITVPAVWSDAAQAKTRACAEKAGMGAGSSLHIVSEPEAAAMYALDVMDPKNLKKGDTFVLCDAGGGTVDLISYTVSALKPTLQIVEASPGSGSLCGSSFLNRIFQKFIEEKLGGQPRWDEEVLEDAMKYFDVVVKRQFGGTDAEEFFVPVSGLSDNARLDVRRGKLRVTHADIKKIFDPIIEEVIALVEGQIQATEKPVKAVLLVGGFGQSAYLRDCIRQAVGSKVEIMQSPNGWTSVVRGALMKALAATSPNLAVVKVTGRFARKNYGTECRTIFNSKRQSVKRRIWSDYEGQYHIDTMQWFIKKGSVVKENKPKRLQYYQTWLKSKGPPATVIVTIHYFTNPYTKGAPSYPDNPDIKRLVKVKADLSRIPAANFPQKKGKDGQVYYLVEYQLEMTHYSASTGYELIHEDVNYGQVAAEYV